jgi:hypothetical protein
MGSYLSNNSGIIMNESNSDIFVLVHEQGKNLYKPIA